MSSLLSNQGNGLGGLWNLLGDEEEEHGLAQQSGDGHGAFLTPGCLADGQEDRLTRGRVGAQVNCNCVTLAAFSAAQGRH